MKHSLILTTPTQARTDMAALWPAVVEALRAGKRLVLSIRSETRSLAENAFLHALLSHIAERQEWAGKKRDADTWKRLLIAAWCRARGEQVELLPAIDGHGVDIVFRRSSELTVGECAELLEFVMSWMSEVGIPIPADPRQYPAPKAVRAAPRAQQREAAECQ